MCGCAAGLLPIQDPQGYVWLSQNVPINLLSCLSAVIDSYGTDGLLRDEGSSRAELLSGGTCDSSVTRRHLNCPC